MADSHWKPKPKQPGFIYAMDGGRHDEPEGAIGEPRRVPVNDAAKFPTRKWIYGHDLIHGFVTVMAAPGGTGKSVIVLAMLLSVALKRPLLGTPVVHQCNVMICSLEDPDDELSRRLIGICQHYNITERELENKLFSLKPDRRLRMGSVDVVDRREVVVFPDTEPLVDYITANNIGVVAVDPFSETHELRESDNPDMVEAMAAWRRVARATGCAVLLVHHERKGGGNGVEGVRGAKAITDSARVVLSVSRMDDKTAEKCGVPEGDRLAYLRIDTGKANLAPQHRARWIHLEDHNIHNGPPSDHVGVPVEYIPPSIYSLFTLEEQLAALDKIAAGTPDGALYGFHRNAKDRWVGWVLVAMLNVDEAQARKLINDWKESGLLKPHDYTNKEGHTVKGVAVDDTKRPGPVQ